MDRQTRQSSLPSSLIPHLYHAPQQPRDSGTRTTLQPVYTLQFDYDEGEPGPSSLHRRGASHPPPDWLTRHRTQQSLPFASHTPLHLPPPRQLLVPSSEPRPSSSVTFDRHDAYAYRPPLSMEPATPQTPESMFYRRPDSPMSAGASNDDDVDAHKRADSLDTDDTRKKNTRKTAVACNFCRGRKLRCNGAKPSCYNCTVRKFECEYVPIQRRRGPGKANKGRGSRSKRAGPSRSDPSTAASPSKGDRPPPEYELNALAPELRPYTSVLSLDDIGVQPPSPPQTRDYARNRETSSDEYRYRQLG